MRVADLWGDGNLAVQCWALGTRETEMAEA